MNRLSSYFQCKKLAKQYLVEAQIVLRKDSDRKAIEHLIRAVENLSSAMNCLSSLAFNKRPK